MPYKDKEKRKANCHAYYIAHQEHLKASSRVHDQVHQEQVKIRKRAHYLNHLEQERTKHRAYNLTHRREKRIYNQTYYRSHREKMKAAALAYQQANPDKKAANNQKRRAFKAGVGHQHYHIEDIVQRDSGICGLCHRKVRTADRSIDHILPLSLGGADAPHNVQLAHLRCNLSKQASGRFPSNLRLPI